MAVSQTTTKGGINFLGTQIHVIEPGRRLAETQQRNQIFILLEPSASKGDFLHGNNKIKKSFRMSVTLLSINNALHRVGNNTSCDFTKRRVSVDRITDTYVSITKSVR